MRMSTTEIADLQNEILEDIFSFLSRVERQHIRHVCKNWEVVVNEAYGIKLVINNANDDLMYSSQWAVEVDFDSMTKSIVDQIVFADKVKTITFRSILVFYNLIPILQQCNQIQKLCFLEVVVDLPEHSIKMPTTEMSLLNLKKLEMHSWSFNDSLMTIFSFFTKINFAQLEEINVPSGYSPVLPIKLLFMNLPPDAINNPQIHSLIRFVLKNIQTLKLFSFGTANSPVQMKFYPFSLFGSPQLENVQISLFHEGWTTIFQTQTHLRQLEVANCKAEQWGELRNSITRNASTLTKVKIHGRTFGQVWDCEIFQPTHLLEKLSLNIGLSPKTGLRFLPISLTFLDIDGPISLTEIVEILNLVNLEELYFKGMGVNLINVLADVDMDEKIDLQLFQRFLVRLPRLKILSFYECSSNSLDWDEICDWCSQISELHRITFRQFFYDMHGQLFKHGLCLTLPEDIVINRGVLEIPIEDPFDQLASTMCTSCFSALGI